MKRIDSVNARPDMFGTGKKAFIQMRMCLAKMQLMLRLNGAIWFRKRLQTYLRSMELY